MKKILFIWLALLFSCSYAFAGGIIWSGGNMTYPGAGVAYTSDGASWGTSLSTDGSGDCAAGAICLGNHTHSTYLSSLSGAVLTDQTTPQTIGATGTRLAYIWATDGTFTNLPSIPLASGYILQGNGSGIAAAVNSLNIATIDMSAQTSSIPWTVGTSTWPTAEGSAKWDSTNDILYIGNTTTSTTLLGKVSGAVTTNTLTKFSGTTGGVTAASTIVEDGTNVNFQALNLVTTGTVEGKIPIIDGGAADISLTTAQVSGKIISNTGQGVNNRNHTLPTAIAGLSFIGVIGEAQGASYYRFTANTTPTPDDLMCLDGTCGKLYVSIAAPTQGAQVTCYTAQIASTGIKSAPGVAIGVTTKNLVYTAAFTFDIAGTGYAASATADGTAVQAATTAQNKYGGQMLEVGVDGTIHTKAGANIAAGYDTAAEALADAQAVAVTAAHTAVGYVTAMQTGVAGFVWATDTFNGAGVTAAYTDVTNYTKPYNWICNKSAGTWVTN